MFPSTEARKDIKKPHPQIRSRIIDALDDIAENPKLQSYKLVIRVCNLYRYRVGNYRIIYRIHDEELEVLILDAKPRGEVYKKY